VLCCVAFFNLKRRRIMIREKIKIKIKGVRIIRIK